ncbi:hypothetical protein BDR03DRAFT_988317, partial [Suillus americanus]
MVGYYPVQFTNPTLTESCTIRDCSIHRFRVLDTVASANVYQQQAQSGRDYVTNFNTTPPRTVTLTKLRTMYRNKDSLGAMGMLSGRHRLVIGNDNTLYVGNRKELDAAIPKIRADHNWQVTLDLANMHRLWPDSNVACLPFSPIGRMNEVIGVRRGTRKSDRWRDMRNNQGEDEHFVCKAEDVATVLGVAIEGGQNSCPGISNAPQNAPWLQGHTSSEHTRNSMANEPLSIGTIEQQYSNMDPARSLMPERPSKIYLSSSCGDDKSAPSPLIYLQQTKMRPAQLAHCSGRNQSLADACVDGEAASRHEARGNNVLTSCHREILYTSN